MKTSSLLFAGGAGSVTGSNFLLDTGGAKLLIDCGLEQGGKELENWEPFPFNPAEVSHLVITHAHIDHIGRIPFLVSQGFSGVILSTKATRALAEPLLYDALELLERTGERAGKPPLYSKEDIAAALGLWRGIGYHERVPLADGVALTLLDAGHILGSGMARLERDGRVLVVTGDLGGGNSPLLAPTERVTDADYLVLESVYGDRTRPDDPARREELEDCIEDTVARGGTLLIPAFSTERTQDLMYEIGTLMRERRVPSVPVYVDSPLAAKITAAFAANPEYFSPPMRERLAAGEELFSFPELVFVESAETSRRIHDRPGPKIIVAGSGMSMGGRVVAHHARILPDKNSTVLIVGYQAAGSLGRHILEGAKSVEIFGERVPVRCAVESIYGYSAHRDGEGLLQFVNDAGPRVGEVFVVQGEPTAASFLAQRIRDYLGVKASVPAAGERVGLRL